MGQRIFERRQQPGILGKVVRLYAQELAQVGDGMARRVFNLTAIPRRPRIAARSAIAIRDDSAAVCCNCHAEECRRPGACATQDIALRLLLGIEGMLPVLIKLLLQLRCLPSPRGSHPQSRPPPPSCRTRPAPWSPTNRRPNSDSESWRTTRCPCRRLPGDAAGPNPRPIRTVHDPCAPIQA